MVALARQISFGTESPRLLLSGLDSLYVSYFIDMQNGRLDFDDLAYRRERLKESGRNKFEEVRLGSMSFALQPYGSKPYSYVLENELLRIRLGEHIQPACHIQFYSRALMHLGLDRCQEMIGEWLQSLELSCKREEAVSRVDWAFD
ncbi:MAG: hypothetical protein HQL45_17650 [Alphaproteobacteria bacterium]|nr:hypothetical protein [Alphaproteobacteria bacterium]